MDGREREDGRERGWKRERERMKEREREKGRKKEREDEVNRKRRKQAITPSSIFVYYPKNLVSSFHPRREKNVLEREGILYLLNKVNVALSLPLSFISLSLPHFDACNFNHP